MSSDNDSFSSNRMYDLSDGLNLQLPGIKTQIPKIIISTLAVIAFLVIFSQIAYGDSHIDNPLLRQPFWEDINFDSPENYLHEITTNLAAGSTIFDLVLYIVSMFIYAVFVWHFYRFISKREIIPVSTTWRNDEGNLSALRIGVYIAGHIFLFPLVIWIWFIIYSWFMFILAKDMPLGVILLIAISVIGATRIASYYKEDLAKDVGKLLPFALLGVFLTSSAFYSDTTNFFSMEDVEERITEIPLFISRIVEFVILVAAIEIILRVLFLIKRKIKPAAEEQLEEKIEDQIDEKIKVKVKVIEEKHDNLEEKIEESKGELEEKIEEKHDNLEEKIEESKGELEEKIEEKHDNLEEKIEESKGDLEEKVDETKNKKD